MKRYPIVAVFLLIYGAVFLLFCGRLFVYQEFKDGNTEGAIRTGIACILFGAIALFDGRLLPRLRTFVKAMMLLIAWGLLAYSDFMNGDIGSALILGIALIVVGITILFQDKPIVKKTIRPGLRPTPYIGVVVALTVVMLLLLLAQ